MPLSFGEVFSALEFVDISYPYLDLDVRQFIYSMSSIEIDSGVRMVYGGVGCSKQRTCGFPLLAWYVYAGG